MGLSPGTKLGPYEIVSPLGAGGMGEVYRARDTQLNRDVALKVLPETLARDPDRMARFKREAQVLASLNHPHIAAIYGFEESDGVRALAMELVEGQTLAELLETRTSKLETGKSNTGRAASFAFQISSFEPLPIAKQIADALEYAHERGIIHRDLKPANIKITPEGAVKVLDFGLAKALDPTVAAMSSTPSVAGVGAAQESPLQNSPTLTAAATQAGVILGTAAYMSPEQARGKTVDRRADIWSFGCVLYELLSGKQTFEGETVTDVLASVVKEEPDWTALPAGTPVSIQKLLHRCLMKDPKQRLRDIGDARIAIEETLSGAADAVAATSPLPVGGQKPPLRPWRRALPWVIAASLAAVTALMAVWMFLSRGQPAERMQFAIPVQAEVGNLALSADGRMLAFVARDDASGEDMLYFERLGLAGANPLPGTEGVSYPFWSPDDQDVGFFANGRLKKVAVSGGSPQVLATASYGRGGSWGSRGVIIYAPETGGPLWRVNADGNDAAPLTDKMFSSDESSHRWPVFLPDGDHFLFWAGTFGGEATGLGSKSGIYLSSLTAKEKKMAVSVLSNPGYANGHLYYVDERQNLIAVALNVQTGSTQGEPIVVSDRVTFQPSVLWGAFGAGGNDTVVYNANAGAALSVLSWYDQTGKELGRVGESGVIANPSISPDGKHATVDIADLKSSNVDVWIEDLENGTSSRFTFDPAEEVTGVWSRDGQKIAYRSIAGGTSSMMLKSATGLEQARVIYRAHGQDDILPNSWSSDGRDILCSFQPAAGGSDLVLLEAATGKMTPFVATKASETNGQISLDGKWAAYASNESGDWEIYVTTFPGAQGKWQVSRGGGTEPRWRGDSGEIYYVDPKGMLTAVPVSNQGGFSAGAPVPLFPVRGRAPISSTDLYTYDVAKDGKRFLVNRYVKPEHVEPLTVVLDAAGSKN
jgi:eukaryotic-like serine/threonine-protein kinase